MLTDVFVTRYEGTQIWSTYNERQRRLMNQAAQLVTVDLFPLDYKNAKAASEVNARILEHTHGLLARELGVSGLHPKQYQMKTSIDGQGLDRWLYHTYDFMTTQYLTTPVPLGVLTTEPDPQDVDFHMKCRISLVELCFQQKGLWIASEGRKRDDIVAGRDQLLKLATSVATDIYYRQLALAQASLERGFAAHVAELNARFRNAGVPLHYHNNLIQLNDDALTEDQVEQPFWSIVAGADWANVDHQMKEALDKRDRGDRDAVSSAMSALESAIKIISDKQGWTTGNERGAANYVNNLVPERNGVRFIEVWERDALIKLFSDIRNLFNHGPGSAPMPKLLPQQSNWAIEACMSWVKSLVLRMGP